MEHGAATADGKTDLEGSTPPSWKMAESGQCTYVSYVNFHSDTRNIHYKITMTLGFQYFQYFPFKFNNIKILIAFMGTNAFYCGFGQCIQGQFLFALETPAFIITSRHYRQ